MLITYKLWVLHDGDWLEVAELGARLGAVNVLCRAGVGHVQWLGYS